MQRLLLAAGVLALVGGGAVAQDPAPPWALTFTHGPLAVKSLHYKDGSAQSYYYLTFKIENKSPTTATLGGIHVKAIVGSDPKKREVHFANPVPAVEETIRRIARADDLKNVQQIREAKTLEPGQSLRGIAVLGTFDREWDIATIHVLGLEPTSRRVRVRKYGDAGFTMPHRAYRRHNEAVKEKAGEGAEFKETFAIVRHAVVWTMRFHREGDEFAPHVDPIYLDSEGWDVLEDPAPQIAWEKEAPFG